MKDVKLQKLIFIYNADSGVGNLLIDSVHKIVSPSTYDCKLCAITFGAFTENTVWKEFRTSTDFEMQFLHKDEFKKQYASKFGYKFTFPIVLSETQHGMEVFINTKEVNQLETADELVRLVEKRIN